MENISYDALEKIGYKGYLLPKDAPEKVLQFGEGNFLRAFVDRFFDMGNEATGWNGKVVMVQPISGAFGFADGINAQDDLYTVLVRGKENGDTVDDSRVISACIWVSAGRMLANTGSSRYWKPRTLPSLTSKSSTPRNLPLEPALVTMVLPPAFCTSVGTGMPSCVCPPKMASWLKI